MPRRSLAHNLRFWARALACLHLAAAGPIERGGLEVQGFSSDSAVLNGLYALDGEVGGYPCYANQEIEEVSLCVDSLGFWTFQPTSRRGTTDAFAVGSKKYTSDTSAAGPWQVRDQAHGDWRADPAVVVTWALSGDDFRVRWTLSVLLLSAVSTNGIMFALSNSLDARLRHQTYLLLSGALSSSTALLLVRGACALLMLVPRMRYLEWEALVTCCLFSCSLMLLTYLGWRVQRSSMRLAAVCSLGAHIAAFLGIVCFDAVQRWAINIGTQRGTCLQSAANCHQAKLVAAMVAIAAVCGALGLCVQLGRNIRSTALAGPPDGGSLALPALSKDPPIRQSWRVAVAEAEDEAIAIIVGCLLVQVIHLYRVGELPVLLAPGEWRSWSDATFWASTAAACLAVSVVGSFAANAVGGRLAWRPPCILAICGAWSAYISVARAAWHGFEDNLTLAEAASAFAVFAASILAVVTVGWVFRGPGDHGGTNRATNVFVGALSLVISLSWAGALDASVGTIEAQLLHPGGHDLTKAVLFASLGAVLVFPWWYDILPKAQMLESGQSAAIARDLNALDAPMGRGEVAMSGMFDD